MRQCFLFAYHRRIFKNLVSARNKFTIKGKQVDFGKIIRVSIKIIEGGRVDISAPRKCLAEFDLCYGLG